MDIQKIDQFLLTSFFIFGEVIKGQFFASSINTLFYKILKVNFSPQV